MKALSCALLWLTVAGMAWPPALAHAQVRYGSIVVEARDQSSSAVPGADVTITETGTNRSRTGVTNSAGLVTFATIPPGTYSVRVNLSGFKEFIVTDVAVSEDSVMRVGSQLEVGQLTEKITVSAGAAILQTDRAEVRTDIPAMQLENLPVPIGRNYQNLFVTVPGISPPENMHSVAVNPARGLAFSSNGTTRNANSIRIEGAISNNLWLPHVAAYVPALEAIESVGVTTSTFDADQGLSGGMSANVLIKSGSNVFRGSGFEYFYDEALKSRPYFLPATEKKPDASQHQFGGTFGGPILRNKAFFFGSYQGTLDRQVANRFGTVPTAAMRNGDFSASPTPIYDPLTGAANYTFDRHNVDAKVNYNPTSKLGIVGRIGWLGYEFRNPPMFGDLGGLPVNSTAAKAGTGLGDTYTFTGSVSHVVTPTFLLDAYLGVTTIEVTSEPDRIDENLGSGYLGIPGTNGTNRLYGGWPHFNITNYSNLGYAGSSHSPYIDDNWQVQYTANATWTKGAHTLKFGGDIVRQAMNRHELGDGSGSFTFGGGPTQIQGGPAGNQFNTIAAFLLGLPTGISKSVIPFENDYTRSRNWQFSFFVRDQWQPTRKLTASLGLRYDKFPMGTRTTRGLERYDPTTNQMLICGVGSVPTDCGYDMGPGNLSPRAGVAYRLTENIVVRGGYGINYDPYPLAFVRNILGNYPSSISLSVPQPNALQPAGRLADGIPAITVPDIGSGIITVPLNVSARALPGEPRRGYIHSWNATVQAELPWGFTGQAGYVATRQREINQIMDADRKST